MLSEAVALGRATLKRPDVQIPDQPLASFGAEIRGGLHTKIRKLLPRTTIICLAPDFATPKSFDEQFMIQHGQLSGVLSKDEAGEDRTVSVDLARKVSALHGTVLFSGLELKQVRLLAFGARWYHVAAGEDVFRQGNRLITGSKPGDLVGELGLIRGLPRALGMRASTDLTCLHLGADDFLPWSRTTARQR